jgi:hypothetical protein
MNEQVFRDRVQETVTRYLRYKSIADSVGILQFDQRVDSESQDGLIQSRVNNRDIMEYGIALSFTCLDVDKMLTNIIDQEPDPNEKRLKLIEKEAVLSLVDGDSIVVCATRVNSLTPHSLPETYAMFKVEQPTYL